MRRHVLLLLAAFFLVLSLSAAPASAAPAGRSVQAKQRIGLIARIRQFEQRKQAWFRRTFGR